MTHTPDLTTESSSGLLRAIGAYAETFRDVRGMTATEVANKTDSSLRTVSRLESGEVSIGIDKAVRIFHAIDANMGALIALADLPNPTPADGERLARAMLEQERRMAGMDAEIDHLLQRITEADYPKLVERLHGYLDGLGVKRVV